MEGLKKKALEGFLQFMLAIALLLFIPAWTIFYWQGWLYWIINFIGILIITLYFLKKDPALIKRRMSAGPGAEKQQNQKVIQSLSSLFLILLFIVSGLDRSFNLSFIPADFTILSDFMVAIGLYIIFLVFKVNTYTSGIVNVDEEQRIITTGPYGVVRHPMYTGSIFIFMFTPTALGSLWSLIPSGFLSIMVIIRLLDEEKYLQMNLKGYKDYKKKVKYRLIPFVY